MEVGIGGRGWHGGAKDPPQTKGVSSWKERYVILPGNGPGTGKVGRVSGSLRNNPDQGGCLSRPEGGHPVRAPARDAGPERAAESGTGGDVERHRSQWTITREFSQTKTFPKPTDG